MRSLTKLLSIGAFLILLSPAVSAEPWMFAGSHEPDNPTYDTPGFMWQSPPPAGAKRVYFGVFSYISDVGSLGGNPNVGALQTQIEIPSDEYHEALLGVWTDCNGDGYVGMAETAVREYPDQLLLDKSRCPANPTGSPNSWNGANNYRGLVTELIPIAREPTARDSRVYRDDAAKVWGDFHRPDERPFQRSCSLSPQSRGTYQTTGGFMNWVDCRVDVIGTMNVVADNTGDPLGIRYNDPDNAAQAGHPLHMETAGTEDESHSPVRVWDCSRPYVIRSGDELNESGLGPVTADETGGGPSHNVALFNPAPGLGNTNDPTVPALLNHTNEGLEGENLGDENSGCDSSDDRGADFYGARCAVLCVGEADFNGVDPNNKHEADWNFGFVTSNRGGAPVSLLGPVGGPGNSGWNEGDLGTGWGGSRWVSDSRWLSKPGPGVLRTDLDDPSDPSVSVAPAYWLTFYAHLGGATLARGFAIPGQTGYYGSWHCGTLTSGTPNGWNCDPDTWYVNPDGTLIPDDDNELARLGETYQLRDVDCYDGSLGDTGLGVEPAFYGPSPCP